MELRILEITHSAVCSLKQLQFRILYRELEVMLSLAVPILPL